MGAACELQQIMQAVAEEYLRQPALFIEAQREQHEKFKAVWHHSFDYTRWYEAKKARTYDWVLLVKGLVSFSKIAHSLIVYGGQPIGGLEESWQLEGNAKMLNLEQVTILHYALASVSLSQADEHFDGHALIFQDFQRFLKEATETNKALLAFVGP